jgi:hypothetical protein
MHHTTDLRNADRAGLARSALGAFLATDLRGDLAPTDPVDVVRAWETPYAQALTRPLWWN